MGLFSPDLEKAAAADHKASRASCKGCRRLPVSMMRRSAPGANIGCKEGRRIALQREPRASREAGRGANNRPLARLHHRERPMPPIDLPPAVGPFTRVVLPKRFCNLDR